jgi:hypothetical protein
MAVSFNVIHWVKGLAAEGVVLAAAVTGMVVLVLGGTGAAETAVGFWAFAAICPCTVVNVLWKHRLWPLPLAASLVALVCPLAWIERLHAPGRTGGTIAMPWATVIAAALAAAACMIGSLVAGRLSGE